MKLLVIGNGESRKSILLDEEVKKKFITVGCNALHRDFTSDYLICCDRRMVEEAVKNPKNINSKIYTRDRYYKQFRKIEKNKNICLLPSLPYSDKGKVNDPDHWGSGPYALLVSANLIQDEIFIIGFDLYGVGNKTNNIYKNTTNYSKEDQNMVDPSFWIYQISKVFFHYQNKKFYLINDKNWMIPKMWNFNNVEFLNINNFRDLTLNTEPV